MKKLITIIMMGGLALTIQAQDITNTLGPSGNYIIEDDSNNEIIKVDASGTFHFKNEVPGSSTQFDLYNAGHNLKLNFYKASGTPSAPTSVSDFSILGILDFKGYTGSNYQLGASIFAWVKGTPSGFTLPTSLIFQTQETGSLTTRMTISPNGYVGVGSDVPNSTLDVAGSMALPVTEVQLVNYTVLDLDHTILTGNPITITLPDPVGIDGRVYVIKRVGDTDTTTVVSAGSGAGADIDGVTSQTLVGAWKYMRFQSTGATWIIIGQN